MRSTARKNPNSIIKEIDHINGSYRKLIEAAPFVAVATAGPEGLDCSPKGDARGFVRILDDKTHRDPRPPGNNRHRRLPQHRARPAHRAAVSDSGRRRDLARERPRIASRSIPS